MISISALLLRRAREQVIDLCRLQPPPPTRAQTATGEVSDTRALEAHDLVANLREHAPDLAVHPLMEGHDEVRVVASALADSDASATGLALCELHSRPHAIERVPL